MCKTKQEEEDESLRGLGVITSTVWDLKSNASII